MARNPHPAEYLVRRCIWIEIRPMNLTFPGKPPLHLAPESLRIRTTLRDPRFIPRASLPPSLLTERHRLVSVFPGKYLRIEVLPVDPLRRHQPLAFLRRDTRRVIPRHRLRLHHATRQRSILPEDFKDALRTLGVHFAPHLPQSNQTPQIVRGVHRNDNALSGPPLRQLLHPLQETHPGGSGLPHHLH